MKKIVLFIIVILTWYTSLFGQEDFWEQTNGPYGGFIKALSINSKGDIFVGTDGTIYHSTDNGISWTAHSQDILKYKSLYSMIINSQDELFIALYFETYHKGQEEYGLILRSSDNGNSWIILNDLIPNSRDTYIFTLAINSYGDIFAGSNKGIFRSTDNGNNWIHLNNGLPNKSVKTIIIDSEGLVYAGSWGSGIYLSTNNGDNWIESGLINSSVQSLNINFEGVLFACIDGKEIYRSTDKGINWSQVLSTTYIRSLVINSRGEIFVGRPGGIFRSTNNGSNWDFINDAFNVSQVFSLVINSNDEIIAGTYGDGLYFSSDNGNAWDKINFSFTNINVYSIVVDSNDAIFAGTIHGVWRSTNKGGNWTLTGLGTYYVSKLAINSIGEIFAGTGNYGIFRSDDKGETWLKVNNGLLYDGVYSLIFHYNYGMFAGTGNGALFRSTDNGENWFRTNGNQPNYNIVSLVIDKEGILFAGTRSNGVFPSRDFGLTWMKKGLNGMEVWSIASDNDGKVFAGTNHGMYNSNDAGNSWDLIGLSNYNISALSINANGDIFAGSNGNILTGTEGGGVFCFKQANNNWEQINNGLTNKSILSLAIDSDGYLFAGTNGAGVYRSKKTTVSVELDRYNGISHLFLTQNYPNPFSTNTEIKFNIQYPDFVTLKIFDELGREIKTLVDDFLDVGDHTAKFDGTGLSTGIYFYSLRTSKGVETKKMVYIAE